MGYKSRTQYVCDFVVAYFVPGFIWRAWARFPYWHRWYWRNRQYKGV